jgi:hypothetical protein
MSRLTGKRQGHIVRISDCENSVNQTHLTYY